MSPIKSNESSSSAPTNDPQRIFLAYRDILPPLVKLRPAPPPNFPYLASHTAAAAFGPSSLSWLRRNCRSAASGIFDRLARAAVASAAAAATVPHTHLMPPTEIGDGPGGADAGAKPRRRPLPPSRRAGCDALDWPWSWL